MKKIDNIGLVKTCLIIMAIAVSIRFSYVFFFIKPEYLLLEDQGQYINLALEFSKVGFLGLAPERMPGYPFFLSLLYSIFGENLNYVIIAQAIIDSISFFFSSRRRHTRFSKGLLISGIISAFNMNMIILSAAILTDTLFLFIFLLFLLSIVNYLQKETWLWLFLSVLFISVSALVRPSIYYLLPVLFTGLILWRLWKKDYFIKIGAIIILCVFTISIVLGGVHHRNYTKYGSTALASDTGTHLLGWVVPATYQYAGMGSYQEGQLLARKGLNLSQENDNLSLLPANPFDASVYQSRVGKKILLEFGFINIFKAWVVGSTINLLAPSIAYAPVIRSMDHPSFYKTLGSNGAEKLYNYIKNIDSLLYLLLLTVGTLTSILFIFFAIWGAVKMILSTYRKEDNMVPTRIIILIFIFIVYFLAITGPIIGVKYRLPIEPIFTILIFNLSLYYANRINRL